MGCKASSGQSGRERGKLTQYKTERENWHPRRQTWSTDGFCLACLVLKNKNKNKKQSYLPAFKNQEVSHKNKELGILLKKLENLPTRGVILADII